MMGIMDTLRGRLLVATPALADDPFRRSVVLVLDHDDEGALGVIINRPLSSEVAAILPEWAGLATAPHRVFDGGPVSQDVALAIGVTRDDSTPGDGQPMLDRIGLVDLDESPHEMADELAGLRVFAGYAGWSPGQLEGEIDEGAWIVVDAVLADVLSHEPETL